MIDTRNLLGITNQMVLPKAFLVLAKDPDIHSSSVVMPLSGLEGYITIMQHIYNQVNFYQQAVLDHSSYAVY